MRKGLIIAGVALAWGVAAPAADFVNLDFEDYSGSGTNLLQGWERSDGDYIWPMLDSCPLVTAGLGLTSSNGDSCTLVGLTVPFMGRYSAHFSSGLPWPSEGHYDEVAIWQIATVPANATHIRYLSSPTWIKDDWAGGHFEIRIQGWLGAIDLSTETSEQGPHGAICHTTGIQSLAGQEAMLKFACVGGDSSLDPGSWHWLDQIEFLDQDGKVIQTPSPGVCLDDFHAATLNTSLWEVVFAGPQVFYNIQNGKLYAWVGTVAEPFDTFFRFRSPLRGDWDVWLDFRYYPVLHSGNTNPGVLGMALAAEFGSAGTSQAGVGQVVDLNSANRRFVMDWGQGPTNDTATTNSTGIFRLVRTGWEVAGYVWDAGSNRWCIVGTADGYTDDVARVGLKVWGTAAFSGKTSIFYADNLMLSKGRACLNGLATKVFGLDENGAPTFSWNSMGIPESNRYFVSRATDLVESAWTPISGEITDSGGETNWTGSNSGAGPFYYRLEVAPP